MGKAAKKKQALREAGPLPDRFDFGPHHLARSTMEILMTGWHCEDCDWPWPLPGTPPDGTECDNCGGELIPDAAAEPVARRPYYVSLGVTDDEAARGDDYGRYDFPNLRGED